jgi:nitroreductase
MIDFDLHTEIKKSVIKSQHCQRNWDLERSIPEKDIETMLHAVTQCPSKQNSAFYKVHIIQNRKIIEKIHKNTKGFRLGDTNEILTNSQTLANLLFVFENIPHSNRIKNKNARDEAGELEIINRDTNVALGIASGYLNLTATMLGYSTGCCQCFDNPAIQKILKTRNHISLMMGVGYKNLKVNRRLHHSDHTKRFDIFKKEEIQVNRIK